MLSRIILALTLFGSSLAAQEVESVYTNLDMEDDCEWTTGDYDGGSAVCAGYGGYPVYLAEGDLRMSAQFGEVAEAHMFHDGFTGFNYVNDVVEWRIEDGVPYATILRWFINYPDADGNNLEAQTLVVSTVADPAAPAAERTSCHVAYIDALANPDPNQMARQVAHLAAKTFRCGVDVPIYVGQKGEFAGGPSQWHPAEFE